MSRTYWYIQLHPSKSDNPEWYKKLGFDSGIDAVKYYIENEGVVGLGLWEEGWDDIRRFVLAQKGDWVFTWYKENGKWYQALMEFLDDEVYYDPDEKVWDGEKDIPAEEFFKKIGVIDKVKPKKVPEKVWFPLFRRVKVLKTWNEKYIDYHPQGTFAQIKKQEVIESLEKF